MNTGFLKQWCLEHDVETRSINAFWYCFRNYRIEDSEEFKSVFGVDFKEDDLTVSLKEVALFIDQWDENSTYAAISHGFDYVVSYIPIVFKGKKLGWYKLFFTLEGETFDDLLTFD
ncbi:hypothetical protein [Brevibacillus porteri]|uniref:Uncharacterized protein n=1 Tax=Brevibacillus porteri TaxID=2126350 RepID=A0ABX5FT31_9BACL|nr:hypothetical protein [Brevibacillus porteri]MED1801813.1 hypothetical protein [Brevibacillus porteri]MED2134944.1 hypothetical protein [Brevibacillus porteri]MED2745466.1 hypothetical protein [Brevibacillus porteri]MED2815788.1 hypothetical protein [Brevibacillus porteri]MED2897626.1 hypothetical protein [Brevibacillus porteri]